jgi:hypothetical protein
MNAAESSAASATPIEASTPYISWGPVVAGAIAASALSFVLLTFASALGLSIASPAPTWRDASVGLAFLSGLFVLLTAVVSFGVGGYLAGRLRSRGAEAGPDEGEFRDGVHGLLVWALAVALGALLATVAAGGTVIRSVPGAASPTLTSAEPIIAYDLDRLLRADRVPPEAEMTHSRAEAGRIALAASGRRELAPEDRSHLVRLVSTRTGLAQPEAERRVDAFIGRATKAIQRARRSAVLVGFLTGAALLLGAAVAWAAAWIGRRERDGVSPALEWQWRRPSATSAR